MSMKVYHVRGVRHQAVIFATSPEEAVAQAIERNLVGDREAPDAVEVPPPPGYYLAYDPLLAAEQPELPLPLAAPEPEKPYTITSSGVKVYGDWRDNIVVDPDAPPLVWKAGRGVFGTHTSVPGRPYLASENSGDALSWNLFRTLELTKLAGLELSVTSSLRAYVRSFRPVPTISVQPDLVESQPQCSPRNYRLGNEPLWRPVSI